MRATLPPSSSTAIKSGYLLLLCRSEMNIGNCSALVIFLLKSAIPPTGYSSIRLITASSTRSVAGAVSALLFSARASGRTINSCPTFSLSDILPSTSFVVRTTVSSSLKINFSVLAFSSTTVTLCAHDDVRIMESDISIEATFFVNFSIFISAPYTACNSRPSSP